MNAKKVAGHLVQASIVKWGNTGCCVAKGFLIKDQRGTDHHGFARDFSNGEVRTSYLEKLRYIEDADTTVIHTRNSVYYAPGNLLAEHFICQDDVITGMSAICSLYKEPQSRGVYLTAAGSNLTGHKAGSQIAVNPLFLTHPQCASDEVPFTLSDDAPSTELCDTFFLREEHYTQVK